VSDDDAMAEAFKSKAQQLLAMLPAANLPPEALQEVKTLLAQAKEAYGAGKMEDAALLAAQALQRAKKG
jgi:hypothetical protein